MAPSSPIVVDADEGTAYALALAQRKERRDSELAAIDSGFARADKARVEMEAKLKHDRLARERQEAERIDEENFAIEKKRRLDRVAEVERGNILLASKLGQGGGDRDSDMKAVRERDLQRDVGLQAVAFSRIFEVAMCRRSGSSRQHGRRSHG